MRTRVLAWLALVVLTGIVFAPALGHEFLRYDDYGYVTGNVMVKQGLTWPGVRWAFSTFEMTNYHPLTWLSLMLDINLYGLRPAGFHGTNILLHAANALILFELFRALTGCGRRSWFIAAVFAVHP